MNSKVLEITVGLFMLAGVAALAFLALQVSGVKDFYKINQGYVVEAYFNNIGGLKKRAKVSLAGVEIGRVTDIRIDKASFTAQVSLEIYRDYDAIPEDSEAYILTAGLLGDNYIGITPGFDDEVLRHKSKIPVDQTHDAIILESLISKMLINDKK